MESFEYMKGESNPSTSHLKPDIRGSVYLSGPYNPKALHLDYTWNIYNGNERFNLYE